MEGFFLFSSPSLSNFIAIVKMTAVTQWLPSSFKNSFEGEFLQKKNGSNIPSSRRFSWRVGRPSNRITVDGGTKENVKNENINKGVRAVRFRPCIDIHKGKVKQIVGSTLRDLNPNEKENGKENEKGNQKENEKGNEKGNKKENENGGNKGEESFSEEDEGLVTNFESEISSGEYASMYKKDDLWGGHVIMLGADSASQLAALEAIQAFPGGLQVGGGVTAENATKYLDNGASHVIVTSYVFREGRVDLDRLQNLVKVVGKKRLVLDLSCRKKDGSYLVVTDRWQRFSEVALTPQSIAALALSADELLVHGVDVEGMRLGIDEELVSLLGRWSPIPVTYAGGARSLEDLERVRIAGGGCVDITVGSALNIFGGELDYEEVVEWHKRQQKD